jgi:hypothetical protein
MRGGGGNIRGIIAFFGLNSYIHYTTIPFPYTLNIPYAERRKQLVTFCGNKL